MEELEIRLQEIAIANQAILNMDEIDYELLNIVRKNMYDTALKYFMLKKKTVLIKRLSWKNITTDQIMEITERGLIQLRYDLKSEVDVKLLKFIKPN